jgi:hypothetical protein
MGVRYRKSFKAGPVRVTASKSGISYSAGVKGARITKRADGRVQTTLSVPGTSLSYTTTRARSGNPQATGKETVSKPPRTPRRCPASGQACCFTRRHQGHAR